MRAGWNKTTLGDFYDVRDGTHDSPKYWQVGYPLITSKNLKRNGLCFGHTKLISEGDYNKINERSAVDKGDVLFAMIGTIGNATVVTVEPNFAIKNVALFKIQDGQSGQFLKYYLDSDNVISKMMLEAKGTTQKFVGLGYLRAFPISVPSTEEQNRIVGILDKAFDGIAIAKANAEKNLQNARALFESHLQTVFTGRGHGWVDSRLSDICREITVGHVGSMAKQYKKSGVPFLRSQNIRPFRVTVEDIVFIDESFHRTLAKSQLRPGDVAIVRTGYPGTAAVIPDTLKRSNCSDLVIVRPGDKVDPHYVAAFFNSSYGKCIVTGRLVGAAQKHFNVTAAKEVIIHLPPVSEQRCLVAKISSLGLQTLKLESIYQQKLAALEALKKSLLHQAFTGDL